MQITPHNLAILGLSWATVVFLVKIFFHVSASGLAISRPGQGAKVSFSVKGGIQNFIVSCLDGWVLWSIWFVIHELK